MRVPWSEIKKYQKPVRGPVGKLLDRLFWFVPYLAVNGGLSANMVTVLAFLFDIIAAWAILNGSYILAAVLIMLSYVGDISDGTVARYWKNKKGYGQYLDEVLGTIGFSFIVLALGLSFDRPWLALASMFAILMMNITTAEAKLAIPEKKKISQDLQNKMGSKKYQIGFTCDIQRTIVALASLFHIWPLLLLFAFLGNGLWLSKFWFYRKY
jgi:phosphatidylglycerophosphate synthase